MSVLNTVFGTLIGTFRSISPFHAQTPEIVQECPHCGFQGTTNAYDYCPRDGTRLQER
jgi:hypothetical protein